MQLEALAARKGRGSGSNTTGSLQCNWKPLPQGTQVAEINANNCVNKSLSYRACNAMSMPRQCHVNAVSIPRGAMSMPCQCHVNARSMPGPCHVTWH